MSESEALALLQEAGGTTAQITRLRGLLESLVTSARHPSALTHLNEPAPVVKLGPDASQATFVSSPR